MVHEESGHDKDIVRPHWADLREDTAALEQTTRASTHYSLTYAPLSRLFLFAGQNKWMHGGSRRRCGLQSPAKSNLQGLPGRTSKASGPHFKGFRAALRPNPIRENFKIGPPVGLGPVAGPILSPARIRPQSGPKYRCPKTGSNIKYNCLSTLYCPTDRMVGDMWCPSPSKPWTC